MERGVNQSSDASEMPMTATERAIQERLAMRKQGKRGLSFRPSKLIIAIIVVAALLLVGWFAMLKGIGIGGGPIDSSKYQAVFFTNGQVYFGKLQTMSDGYLKLSDVFYLQTKTAAANSDNLQSNTTKASDVELIKLGNEVHGPEDAMIVSRDQVLFFENLKKDGTVTKSIDKYKSSQN